MAKKSQYKGAFKIDLKGKTNDEKYDILKWLKPLAPNYYKGHYSISEIERNYDLIGKNCLNGFTCFSVSTDKRFKAHLSDSAFIQIPYESLDVKIDGSLLYFSSGKTQNQVAE